MPLAFRSQSPVMGIWKITEPWQEMLDLLQNKTNYAIEVLNIQSENRKCEWLAVRLLVELLAGSACFVSYKENGAPFLQNNLYISISHTKGFAAVILSQNAYPGIDIEYRSERALKLCGKFLSEHEIALLPENDITSQATLATLCWCAKETAYKALQETGIDFIKHLQIAPFTLCEKGILSLKETKSPNQKTYPIHYQVTEDYILTWKE